MTQLITIIQVVGPWVVKVHGQLHQPKTEHTGVEIDVALRVAGNRRHMMNSENISTHSLYPSLSLTLLFFFLAASCSIERVLALLACSPMFTHYSSLSPRIP